MCARSGQKKYNKLCPLEKDTEIRRERKNDFRGLDVGEGVYEGKMKKVIKNGTVNLNSSVFYRMNVFN